MVDIRLAKAEDLALLGDIELSADQAFEKFGYPIGDGALQPVETLELAQKNKLLWVATIEGEIVGFVLILIIDGHPHLEQVSVLERMQKKGIGAQLVDTVLLWAKENGYSHINLSTTTDVPFNMPFYKKKGFMCLVESELDEYMYGLRDSEKLHGLNLEKRVFMRYLVK